MDALPRDPAAGPVPRILLSTLLAVLLPAAARLAAAEEYWAGQLEQQGKPLPIDIQLEEAAGRFSVPDWGVADYPLAQVTRDGARVRWRIGDDTLFDGTVAGTAMDGTFSGSEGKGTYHLERVAPPAPPYRSEPVSFGSDGARLAGSLYVPTAPGPHPAVVLLHGSGAQTRWGTNAWLAGRFASAGFVALAFDKRGSGESGGDWRQATFEDLARDALAAAGALRERADVDPARIGVLGHSQGGIIVALACGLDPQAFAFAIAEDSPAGPVWQQDAYRVRNALRHSAFSDGDQRNANAVFGVFLEVARGVRPYSDLEREAARWAGAPWLEWLDLPPREAWTWDWYRRTGNLDTLAAWSRVASPVLLVYGTEDQLLPPRASARAIAGALHRAGTPVTTLYARGAQHNLTLHAKPGRPFEWWHRAPGIDAAVIRWAEAQRGPVRAPSAPR